MAGISKGYMADATKSFGVHLINKFSIQHYLTLSPQLSVMEASIALTKAVMGATST